MLYRVEAVIEQRTNKHEENNNCINFHPWPPKPVRRNAAEPLLRDALFAL